MLLNHCPDDIMGKWDNLTIDGDKLKAEAVFDEKDDQALKMYNKADQGMLNCTSISVDIKEAQMGYPGFPADVPVVTKCVMLECSVTPMPSNQNALKCFINGEEVSNDQVVVKLSSNNLNNKIQPEMKKLEFFIAALSLAANANEDDVLKAVNALSKKATDLEGEVASLKKSEGELTVKLTAAQGEVKAIQTAKVDELIDGAEKLGKLTADMGKTIADKKLQLKNLANVDFDLAKSMIDALPVRKSLSATIENGAGAAGAGKTFEGWGLKRLHKEAPTELARIKAEEPDRFKELLKANA